MQPDTRQRRTTALRLYCLFLVALGGVMVTQPLVDLPIDTAAAQTSVYDGRWRGNTSQRRQSIQFEVENGSIKTVLVDITITGQRNGQPCVSTFLHTESSFDAIGLAVITGNAFTVLIENEQRRFEMNGIFQSGTQVIGNLRLTTRAGQFDCIGTGFADWSAGIIPNPPSVPPGPSLTPIPVPIPELPPTGGEG